MVSLVFCDILQLPHTVISNSEKLTHPTVQHFTVISYTVSNHTPAVDVQHLLIIYYTDSYHTPSCSTLICNFLFSFISYF